MNTLSSWSKVTFALLSTLLAAGCATVPEQALRERHDGVGAVRDSRNDPPGPDAQPSALIESPATLDAYMQHAFRHNPRLRAAFDRWQAALERIPQARSLDDPTLTFEYFIDQMDTRYRLGISQMFPTFGVLGLREDRAAAEAQAAMHAFDAERFMLFDRLTDAFYEYHYLARSIAVTEENHRLLADLEQAVEARYRSGAASFADLIKVQIEKERLADRLAALREQRRPQSSELAALLNLPADEPLPWPEFETSGPSTIDERVLAGMLADLNPELKAADAMIEAAGHREELARRSGWPSFMVGAGWMVMSGMDGRGDESDIGLMAGITLPVWRGRYRAERRETAVLTQAVTHDRDNMRNRLRAELSMAVFRFRDAERRISLFQESLVPKAEQALAVARQAYGDGQTDFMTLIDAQRTLLEFQLMAERAVADREIALGDIGCCVGLDPFDRTDRTAPFDRKLETIP